jgi:Spy/CpxP family protein refolding chaperone
LNQDPELGNAVAAEDDQKIREIIGARMKKQLEHKRKEMEKQKRLMNADPNDEAAQKEIEEEIRREMVNQNYEFA